MKKIFLLVLLVIMLLTFSGCCTKPRNDECITAYITLPDREIAIDVAKFIRVSKSCTRIQSSDGIVYECHPNNVIFVTTKK